MKVFIKPKHYSKLWKETKYLNDKIDMERFKCSEIEEIHEVSISLPNGGQMDFCQRGDNEVSVCITQGALLSVGRCYIEHECKLGSTVRFIR